MPRFAPIKRTSFRLTPMLRSGAVADEKNLSHDRKSSLNAFTHILAQSHALWYRKYEKNALRCEAEHVVLMERPYGTIIIDPISAAGFGPAPVLAPG